MLRPQLTIVVQNQEIQEATVTKEEIRHVHVFFLVDLPHGNCHLDDQRDSKTLRKNEINFENWRWMELSSSRL
jgi:hypothetical protein